MKTIIEEMVEDREDEIEKRKALKIAQKMKDKGKSIDEIIEMTDLTVDDILRL
jgi:predicted transposase YdaD